MLAEVGEDVDVLYTVFSPLAVLGLICGGVGQPLLGFAAEDAASVHGTLNRLTEILANHARLALKASAAGLFYAPLQWSSRRVCDEDFYREFGRPYDLQLLQTVPEAEFNVLHVCGNDNMLEWLLDYPVHAINWADHGEGNDSLAEARGKTSLTLMGGIENAHLHEATPDDVTTQAREALAACPDRFMLAGGCGISPLTPAAVKDAVVAAVR